MSWPRFRGGRQVHYANNSDHQFDLPIVDPNITEADGRALVVTISQKTLGGDGHDTWRFNARVDLRFDSGVTLSVFEPGIHLRSMSWQDHPTWVIGSGFRPLQPQDATALVMEGGASCSSSCEQELEHFSRDGLRWRLIHDSRAQLKADLEAVDPSTLKVGLEAVDAPTLEVAMQVIDDATMRVALRQIDDATISAAHRVVDAATWARIVTTCRDIGRT